jgi:hypothetical protein
MQKTFFAAALAAALMGITAASASAVEPGPNITPAARDQVEATLISRGVAPDTAEAIAWDDDAVQSVPMTMTTEVQGDLPPNTTPDEITQALAAAPPSTESAPKAVSAAIGSCSGYYKSGSLFVYNYNNFNAKLAHIKLTLNWCFNNSRVTWASWNREYYVYGLAKATWNFRAWTPVQQYFYVSGGRSNGGVFTSTQAHFDICVLKYGCYMSADPYAEIRGYYNGTWYVKGRP